MSIFEKYMDNSYKFKVAGHVFEAVLPEEMKAEEYLRPYLPFLCDDGNELIYSLRLELVDELDTAGFGDVKECINSEAPYFWIFEKDGRFGFSYTKERPDCLVRTAPDFSEGTVYVPREKMGRMSAFALSNAMMLMYTFTTGCHDTLMTHASVIRYRDCGYMFLGKSGTGKSTHSRMWLNNIEGAELLNDDNPIVRVIDGKAYVFGSPWSGKTPCYKNEVVPLKGIVRIVRAPYNKASRLSALQSYASLLPSCSCMRWDGNAVDALHKTVEKVISNVACWSMECLPDADAALTCHASVTL